MELDLDSADDVARLWSEYAQLRARQDVDPELRADLERLLPEIPEPTRSEIVDALNYAAPAVVLAEWGDSFFEARFGGSSAPALGAFDHLRRELPKVDLPAEIRQRDHDDPAQLVEMVRDLANVTDDRRLIVETAVAHARECGIDESVFKPIIKDAVRELTEVSRVD